MNFIIGGTEKAGTTSIFSYLSMHPEVCGSCVKETDFFRNDLTGNTDVDFKKYNNFFSRCSTNVRVNMEASPGYLAAGLGVVKNMHALVPDAKILFILRSPIDRLYSSYNFHVTKLNIDENIGFEEYVRSCISYDANEKTPEELGIGEWYLKAFRAGDYFQHLKIYYSIYPESQVKVVLYEDLKNDVSGLMRSVCDFINVSPDYFDSYEFNKVNVTFSSKNKFIHKFAMLFNEKTEGFLRQRPGLKRILVALYKKINQSREGYDPMTDISRQLLVEQYKPGVDGLKTLMLDREIPWGMNEQERKALATLLRTMNNIGRCASFFMLLQDAQKF